ncbi:MAG: hypothetical protein P0Y66_22225 [Candidatus Kaistia colombiensis]|nr:MAG: hypothetical protein P0Y66_22225 [Kaistia sp.]
MVATKKPALGDMVVSASAASALIGITPERVRQRTVDGWIKKNSKGQNTLRGVVGGYVAFLKAEERRTSKVQSESGLKAVIRRAKLTPYPGVSASKIDPHVIELNSPSLSFRGQAGGDEGRGHGCADPT